MTKLFVGGIPYSITNQKLQEIFQQFGTVTSVNIITDKFSGQSKGFAFVEMEGDAEAQEAIKKLDGSDMEGRRIGVSVARPREDSQNRGGGFNQNRGDFQRNDNFRREDRRRR